MDPQSKKAAGSKEVGKTTSAASEPRSSQNPLRAKSPGERPAEIGRGRGLPRSRSGSTGEKPRPAEGRGGANRRAPGVQAAQGKPQSERGKQRPQLEDEWEYAKQRCRKLLLCGWFDIGMGVIILTNALTVGIEQSLELNGKDTTPLKVVESLFLVIYIIEIGIRIFAFGCAALHQNWVRFDLFLLLLGVLTSWILEPAMDMEDSSSADFTPLMVLRTARVLRLAKTARFLSRMQEFWILVRGFLNSASILLYIFAMLLLLLYVFGLVGVEIITKHTLNETDMVFAEHAQKYFNNLPQTMLTLARFACLDNTSEVYKPFVDRDPWLAIYFMLIFLVISIVFFHLLGAVVFSSTLEQNVNKRDQEKRWQAEEWAELIEKLKDMFVRLDADNSGQLSRDEVMDIAPEDCEKLCEALEVRTPIQVFNALDIDKSGTVSINEFIDGVWDLAFDKGDVEMKRMEKQVETMHWRLKETFSLQHELSMQVQKIFEAVQSLREKSEPPDVPESVHKRLGMGPVSRQSSVQSMASEVSVASKHGVGNDPVEALLARSEAALSHVLEQLRLSWDEALRGALEEPQTTRARSRSPTSRGNGGLKPRTREAGTRPSSSSMPCANGRTTDQTLSAASPSTLARRL